jgi:hypothetical protein
MQGDAIGERHMNGPVQRIVVVDLRVPFFRLVLFFVKAALAAIPVAFILFVLSAALAALVSSGYLDPVMRRFAF